MEDLYKTITKPTEGLYKEKGSKFIAYAYPVLTEDDIKVRLEELKAMHSSARHFCYAYNLGSKKEKYRANDDGEPSNTAGKPIHGQINSKDLTNTFVVVVRYFGGTKLGASGLINAYKLAAQDALDQAEITEKTVNDIFKISFTYDHMNTVMRLLKENNLEMQNQKFEIDCALEISIRQSDSENVKQQFEAVHGLKIEYLGTY